jgi:hypothetical protein
MERGSGRPLRDGFERKGDACGEGRREMVRLRTAAGGEAEALIVAAASFVPQHRRSLSADREEI